MRYEHENENEDSSGSHNSSGTNMQSKSSQSKPAVLYRCPTCDARFERSTTKVMPFCTIRCQQIDLGRWFNESNSLPYEGGRGAEGFGPADTDDEL